MGIFTRRNAFIGWFVLKFGRPAVKRLARDVVPGPRTGGVAVGALAAVAGVLLFWRNRSASAE
jgi:hypothetical protein